MVFRFSFYLEAIMNFSLRDDTLVPLHY